MASFTDLFGEFLRETLVQLAYLHYEVARLKGRTHEEALQASQAGSAPRWRGWRLEERIAPPQATVTRASTKPPTLFELPGGSY